MNKFFIYILYSKAIDHFYNGQSINVNIRLVEHLIHSMPLSYTKRADDWIVFFQLECSSRKQAILIENHIKGMKSRKYIRNLAEFPNVGKKLLERFQ
jgi:putative endonuclease